MSVTRAVLWDMDGTLIDSEEFHWISWRDTLANEGIAITHEQFLSSFGQRNDSILPRWLGTAATPERIERIANAKEELYRQLLRRRRARISRQSLRLCRLPISFTASSPLRMCTGENRILKCI